MQNQGLLSPYGCPILNAGYTRTRQTCQIDYIERAREDTHDVALDVFLAEPAPLERINGEDESLDQNTTFQGDVVQVNRFGRIVNQVLPWDRYT